MNLFTLALASLKTRKVSFFGSFLALTLGTTLIAMTAQALAATFGGDSSALETTQSMAAATGVIAASVAVFVVISTFAFVVEQRGRELALLRLIGTTPQQLRRMILAEAALLGAAAAVCGCALGALASTWFNHWLIRQGIAPSWFHIGVQPIALLVAALLGLLAALAGAGAVAYRAGRARSEPDLVAACGHGDERARGRDSAAAGHDDAEQ